MTFQEVLAQVIAWLQREQRVSYRALKRQLELDDDYLEDLKDELIYAKKLAVDEDGRVLVWTGGPGTAPVSFTQSVPCLPSRGASLSCGFSSQPRHDAERSDL